MKIKMIYQIGAFYYEAECLNEQERKEAIKGLIYATKDLYEVNLLSQPQTIESEPVCYEEQGVSSPVMVEEQAPIEYATEGQKKYMAKLGIAFTDETTKIEAIDLINAWKTAHNIPIGKKN